MITFFFAKYDVRVIPVVGKGVGDVAEFGGLLGYAPIIPVNTTSCEAFVNRGGPDRPAHQ